VIRSVVITVVMLLETEPKASKGKRRTRRREDVSDGPGLKDVLNKPFLTPISVFLSLSGR
jgi:hypothetical protein